MPVKWKMVPCEKKVVESATCDNCGEKLLPVMGEGLETPQFDKSLDLNIQGGYGEFIDGGGRAHLCEKCATKFFETFPALAGVIKMFGDWCDWKWEDGKLVPIYTGHEGYE